MCGGWRGDTLEALSRGVGGDILEALSAHDHNCIILNENPKDNSQIDKMTEPCCLQKLGEFIDYCLQFLKGSQKGWSMLSVACAKRTPSFQ